MADEVPVPETPAEVSMVFSKTTDHGGGGSETVSAHLSIPQLGDASVDDVVLALLPVLENDGWVFQHIQVKTTDYSTYDPRNP